MGTLLYIYQDKGRQDFTICAPVCVNAEKFLRLIAVRQKWYNNLGITCSLANVYSFPKFILLLTFCDSTVPVIIEYNNLGITCSLANVYSLPKFILLLTFCDSTVPVIIEYNNLEITCSLANVYSLPKFILLLTFCDSTVPVRIVTTIPPSLVMRDMMESEEEAPTAEDVTISGSVGCSRSTSGK